LNNYFSKERHSIQEAREPCSPREKNGKHIPQPTGEDASKTDKHIPSTVTSTCGEIMKGKPN
jgi:hypothetical protein